jgi:hypothetical protein
MKVIIEDAIIKINRQQMLLIKDTAEGSLFIEIKFLKSFKSLKSSSPVFRLYRSVKSYFLLDNSEFFY